MKKLYDLIYDTTKRNQKNVAEYDDNDFDITVFWQGKTYNETIPKSVRLYVDSKKPTFPDFMANPISWLICSERLVNIFQARASNCLQLFDAPLFDQKTKEAIAGYKVVNIVKLIPCLDFNKSVVSYSEDGSYVISIIDPVYIEDRLPRDAHLFRVVEDKYRIIVSKELADDLVKERVTGIALIEYEAF